MPGNFVGEPFTVSKYSGTEKVWITERGGWGVSRFSFEKFFSHSAEGTRGVNPLVLQLFRVSKKFG